MNEQHKIAFIQRMIYPDPSAAAIQSLQMAAAFSRHTGDAHLFLHDLNAPREAIFQHYGIDQAPLNLWSMHLKRNPLYYHSMTRFLTFNTALAGIFALHPQWRQKPDRLNVLFVRSRLESIYWGLMRPYLWWMRGWHLIFEAHDLDLPMQNGRYDYTAPRVKRTLRALKNYDLVLALTNGLADDIATFSQGQVQAKVVPLCTGLPRLDQAPQVSFAAERVVLGYVGTIDRSHGIDDLFNALQHLPTNYTLRLVGRVSGRDKTWLDTHMADSHGRVELRPAVPYNQVAAQIDACDMVLAPAGPTLHTHRYRSPLKVFDYMARGKPIIAAGVPSHLELLSDGLNAQCYPAGDGQQLAAAVRALVENPAHAQHIAHAAWQESQQYTYSARAQRIIQLINQQQAAKKS